MELFRTAQNELAEAREKYKEGSSSVNELARELAQVRVRERERRIGTERVEFCVIMFCTLLDHCRAGVGQSRDGRERNQYD